MEIKSKKNLEKFLEPYRTTKYKKDELISQPGEILTSIFLIKSGCARIYAICKNGQEVTIQIHKACSYFPQFFVGPKTKSQFYAEAITPLEVWKIPKKEAVNFLVNNPEIIPEAMDFISHAFRELLLRIENLVSGNAYTKVVGVLLSLAGETNARKNQVALDLTLTHRIIASLTGLTRETVTLQILKLKKEGLVSGKGRSLIINDLAKLKEESACPPEES